jgi:hypothetical protein
MLEKQQQQKEYYFIQEKHTKSEKFMMERLRWIGWNKKEKEVSQLRQLQQQHFGKDIK